MAQITEPNVLNPQYYWNNAYNPSLVRYRMHEDKNKMWHRSKEVQKVTANIKPVYGKLSDFKVDYAFNKDFGLCPITMTYCINKDIYPSFHKEDFMRKYNFGTPISLQTIMNDNHTFSHRILCYLGKYLFMGIKLIALPNGTVICIEINTETGISKDIWKKLVVEDNKFCLMFDCKSESYYAELKRDDIFNDDYIKLSKFTCISNDISRKNMVNYYHIFATANEDESNLLMGTYGYFVKHDTFGQCFQISPEFKSFIASNTRDSIKLWVFNEYNISGAFRYDEGLSKLPYIHMDNVKDISSEDNIFVYEFDPNTNTIGSRINIHCEILYPNIMKFDLDPFNTDNPRHVFVEYHEEIVNSSLSDFDDAWSIYIDVVGQDKLIMDYWSNSLHPALKNYKPLETFEYDYDDFVRSKFYKDVRAYDLSKLILLDTTNPWLFNAYTRMQHEFVRVFKTMSINPEDVKMYKDTRDEMDTSIVTGFPQMTLYFTEPMMYVMYSNSENYKKHTELFIGGKRIMHHTIETNGHASFVFFKPEYVHEGDEVTLVVCRYPFIEKHEVTTEFPDRHEFIPFPNPEIFGNISISNIIYWDPYTKEWIYPNDMDYNIVVDSDIINNPYTSDDVVIGVTNKSYLLTHQIEYYSTIYKENILLDKDKQVIPPIQDFDYSSSKKEIDSSRLEVSIKDEKYILKEIGVTNTNNSHIGRIPDCSDDKDDHLIIFHGWKEDPSPSRFRAYHNGLLLGDDDYIYNQPKHYGDDAIFDFSKFKDGEIILDYLPYVEDRVYTGVISDIDDNHFSEGDISKEYSDIMNIILVDMAKFCDYAVDTTMIKVYIDGKILNPARIHETKALGYFTIDCNGYENTKDIVIYVDKMDNDMFQYQQMLNSDVNRKLISVMDISFRAAFIRDSLARPSVFK